MTDCIFEVGKSYPMRNGTVAWVLYIEPPEWPDGKPNKTRTMVVQYKRASVWERGVRYIDGRVSMSKHSFSAHQYDLMPPEQKSNNVYHCVYKMADTGEFHVSPQSFNMGPAAINHAKAAQRNNPLAVFQGLLWLPRDADIPKLDASTPIICGCVSRNRGINRHCTDPLTTLCVRRATFRVSVFNVSMCCLDFYPRRRTEYESW